MTVSLLSGCTTQMAAAANARPRAWPGSHTYPATAIQGTPQDPQQSETGEKVDADVGETKSRRVGTTQSVVERQTEPNQRATAERDFRAEGPLARRPKLT